MYLPATGPAGIRESGKPLNNAVGVRFLRMENQRAVLAVTAGSYRFESALP